MNGHITRILGIAPYESMKTSMQNLADSRKDLILDVYVGDLEEGTKIVRQNLSSNYDVIISRGGTAQMIASVTSTPVVEINMSVYDVLRAIKLGENYSGRYAVVGFPAITESARLLCSLLQYQIDIFTIHNEAEVRDIVKQLKNDGYHMLLCDMIASTVAREFGLNAILITSGVESIENAFDQAVKLAENYAGIQAEKHFLEELLKADASSKVAFHPDGEIFFSSWNKKDEIDTDAAIAILKKEIDETLASGKHKFFKNIGNKLYAITCVVLEHDNKHCPAFYLNATKIPPLSSKYGLSYANKKDVEEYFFNSFYSITGASGITGETIARLAESTLPVMLTGEPGTGKTQTIRTLYTQSPLASNPLITIDFDLVNDKSWEFLINHYNSPLNDNDNTIYFKNVNQLNEDRCRHLLSIIIDMNLSKRNRLFFSCVSRNNAPISPACQSFTNILSCLTLHQTPLRERTFDIPALSSLYLGTLNVKLAKQLIGFEPDALALMQEYDWPLNHTQFKRVLSQLATITDTPYIQAEDVEYLLAQECASMTAGTTAEARAAFNVNRSLEDITKDIVSRVLQETGGNQSAAAKRLEISRTTLWRYLKS